MNIQFGVVLLETLPRHACWGSLLYSSRHYLDVHVGVLFFILPDITSTCMLGFSSLSFQTLPRHACWGSLIGDITSTCMLGFSSLSFQTLPRRACWGSLLYPSRHYLDMHVGVLFFILPDITSTCMLGFSNWGHYLDVHVGVLFFILPDITSTCMLGFSNWGHYLDVHVGVLFFILPDIDLVKFQVTLHFRPRAKTGCFSERFTVSDEGVRLFCCQHFLHFFWET